MGGNLAYAAGAYRTPTCAFANARLRGCCYAPPMGVEEVFRSRLKQVVLKRYKSLDRFYLETDFSKGHLSQIIRGKRSPSLATIVRLAKVLEVDVVDFFLPEKETKK